MLKCNSAKAVAHARKLTGYQLASIPAENTRDARLIARAELDSFWTDNDAWTVGLLLELSSAIEDHVFDVCGDDFFAIFDYPALGRVIGNRSAALMACKLAGGYFRIIDGKEKLTNRGDEDQGRTVSFDEQFVREWWHEVCAEMEYVLTQVKK